MVWALAKIATSHVFVKIHEVAPLKSECSLYGVEKGNLWADRKDLDRSIVADNDRLRNCNSFAARF